MRGKNWQMCHEKGKEGEGDGAKWEDGVYEWSGKQKTGEGKSR